MALCRYRSLHSIQKDNYTNHPRDNDAASRGRIIAEGLEQTPGSDGRFPDPVAVDGLHAAVPDVVVPPADRTHDVLGQAEDVPPSSRQEPSQRPGLHSHHTCAYSADNTRNSYDRPGWSVCHVSEHLKDYPYNSCLEVRNRNQPTSSSRSPSSGAWAGWPPAGGSAPVRPSSGGGGRCRCQLGSGRRPSGRSRPGGR